MSSNDIRNSDTHNSDREPIARIALIRFIEAKGLNIGRLARLAKFPPSAIYNLKSRRTQSPSTTLLQKIATATGCSVSDILAYGEERPAVVSRYAIVSGGRMLSSSAINVPFPPTVDPTMELDCAIVAGDGLHPVPAGWRVFFKSRPGAASDLIGELCVVRGRDTDAAVIGYLRPGARPNTYDVQPWHGPVIPAVTVLAAHRVISLQPPEKSEM